MKDEIRLRSVMEADLPFLFAYQLDREANYMAAFTAKDPTDREAFEAKWARILGDEGVVARVVLVKGKVAGSFLCFDMFGRRQVGYWLGRDWWGRGIATAGLGLFLEEVGERPLYAQVAYDNYGSLRVLAKCGFERWGMERGMALGRGEEIDEVVMILR
ncbi:MAG TPA: GNAT family protein [Anaerolineae bacterium]|nr:GNAT family protein [Anaerolineae bacterium]